MRRSRGALAITGVAVLAAAGATGFLFFRGDPPPLDPPEEVRTTVARKPARRKSVEAPPPVPEASLAPIEAMPVLDAGLLPRVSRPMSEKEIASVAQTVATLAQIPGHGPANLMLEKLASAGPEAYPAIVDEVLAKGERVAPEHFATLARGGLEERNAPARRRILEATLARFPSGGERPPDALAKWADVEPDSEIRLALDRMLGRR